MPADIPALHRAFYPLRPLPADSPLYVDTLPARGVTPLLRQLALSFSAEGPSAQFFTGHTGDGKSTLLLRLRKELEAQGFLVAYGEADRFLSLNDLEVEDLLVGLAAILHQAVQEKYPRHPVGTFLGWLWDELRVIPQFRAEEAEVTLKPFDWVEISTKMRDDPDVREQVRQRLRRLQGKTFLGAVNEFVAWAQKRATDNGAKGVVLILDNLDRVPPAPAASGEAPDTHLFLGAHDQLRQFQCHVLYVVRLNLVTHQSNNLRQNYGAPPRVMPMIPVRTRAGDPNPAGLEALRTIARLRVEATGCRLEEVFGADAAQKLDTLALKCGGHLRDFLLLVQETLGTAAALPVTGKDVENAIQAVAAGPRLQAGPDRDVLQRIAQEQALPPDLDEKLRRRFLDQGMVYQYLDDEYWYAPNPLHGEFHGPGS